MSDKWVVDKMVIAGRPSIHTENKEIITCSSLELAEQIANDHNEIESLQERVKELEDQNKILKFPGRKCTRTNLIPFFKFEKLKIIKNKKENE